ncbi:MAG: serine protease [Candidatus Cyclonatronum sp.]|uniref:S1 family peptidase n=1 Tax=Cyclonatronum sp. TaxID=3024185 RepID=UPI0025C28570|nr:serine protease [Cyclonatronum sp.]MCH8486434.1 serine protease [Cyclonatronum sp.]
MNLLLNHFAGLLLTVAIVFSSTPDLQAQTAKGSSAQQSQRTSSGPDINALSTAAAQIVTPVSTGSGSIIVIEDMPFVFTNRHVVQGHTNIEVHTLHDIFEPARPTYKASLLMYSMEYDFAVYVISTDMQGNAVSAEQVRLGAHRNWLALEPLELPEMDYEINRGEPISILSFPGIGDNELVYSQGIVSSVKYEEIQGQRLPEWIRTNAEFSPGSSGGIALDKDGLFIGLPTYVRTEQDTGGRLGSILSIQLIAAVMQAEDIYTSWDYIHGDSGIEHGLALNINGEPHFGTHRLRAGFTPDPHTVQITAGGSVDVSYLGSDCIGHADQRPDAQLFWSGSSSYVTFRFQPDNSGDTTLIINAPDGSWYCNDDESSGTLNPGITFFNPSEGRYDIWVGTYRDGEFIDGKLLITELDTAGDQVEEDQATFRFTASPAQLRLSARPAFGSVSLRSGFLPDPHSVQASGGGTISLEDETDNNCVGFVSSPPSVELDWSGGGNQLQFFFRAGAQGGDATMLVRDPAGFFFCNDDVHPGNLNPGVNILNPANGRYQVWLGTFNPGNPVHGRLEISEGYIEEFQYHDDFEDDFYYDDYEEPVSTGLDWTLSPHFGTANLQAGFTPDPHRVRINAGGFNDVWNLSLGSGCVGYASTAPDFRLHWDGSSSLLHFFFVADNSDNDTTLIINAPDGSWHCNDDATSNTLNPFVRFDNPRTGQYDVWVGTYQNGAIVSGELRVSELTSGIPR